LSVRDGQIFFVKCCRSCDLHWCGLWQLPLSQRQPLPIGLRPLPRRWPLTHLGDVELLIILNHMDFLEMAPEIMMSLWHVNAEHRTLTGGGMMWAFITQAHKIDMLLPVWIGSYLPS